MFDSRQSQVPELKLPEPKGQVAAANAIQPSLATESLPSTRFKQVRIAVESQTVSGFAKSNEIPEWMSNHLVKAIRNADPGSPFAKVARILKFVPKPILIPIMRKLRYDGIVIRCPNHIAGHLFFQRHADTLHVFSISVDPSLRGNRLATKLVDTFIEWSRSRLDISAVRLGGGGSSAVKKLVLRLHESKNSRGFVVDENYFLRFTDRVQRNTGIALGAMQTMQILVPRETQAEGNFSAGSRLSSLKSTIS